MQLDGRAALAGRLLAAQALFIGLDVTRPAYTANSGRTAGVRRPRLTHAGHIATRRSCDCKGTTPAAV